MRLVPVSCVRVCHSIGLAHVCTGVPVTKLTDLSPPGCSFTTDPLRSDIAHFFVITLPQTRQTATFCDSDKSDFQAPTRAVRPGPSGSLKTGRCAVLPSIGILVPAAPCSLPHCPDDGGPGYRGANEMSEGRGRAARGRIAGRRPIYDACTRKGIGEEGSDCPIGSQVTPVAACHQVRGVRNT
jgi:hypothetical protein